MNMYHHPPANHRSDLRLNGMNGMHFPNENQLGTIGTMGSNGMVLSNNNDMYNMKPPPMPSRSDMGDGRGKWMGLEEQEHLHGALPNMSQLNLNGNNNTSNSNNNMIPSIFRTENDPVAPTQNQPMLKNLSHSSSIGNMDAANQSSLIHSSSNVAPTPTHVYTVKFKRTQRNFILGPRMQRDAKIGSYVKVEADRGEDLGIVTSVSRAPKSNDTKDSSSDLSTTSGAGTSSSTSDLKRIIRLATNDEINLLTVKRKEEDELLKVCRTKTLQRALPMKVVDAEYQFDRNKLTFFFEAEGRIDFRELVRDLFSMYKTRIWMQQIDKAGAPPLLADTHTPVATQ